MSGPSREHAAATLWLAVVALGLWLRRERLRRALLLGVLLGVAMPAGVPARAASLCAGDCDASGSITVDELVTLVNATLGNVDASACGAGDVNRDGQITADELVAAVSSATNGCPPAPAVVAATTQVVTRALSYLSSLQLLISAGITGSGSPDNCDVGGMYTSRCEDDGSEFIRIPVTLTACGVATSEGTVVLDGVMTIRGVGLCPSVLFPGDITIELTGSTRLGASNGTPLLQSDVQVTGAIDAFAFGAGPCRIKGGRGSITGTVRYQTPPDREVTVDFSDTQLEIQLSQFQANPLCDPGTVVLGVDGLMRIRDTYAQPSVTVDAKLHGVAVTLRRLDGVIEISGTVEAAGLGGSAQLRTIEPLVLEAGAPCFTGGILDVTSPYELTRIAYGPGGSVQIDAAADGVVDASFDSCLDLPRSGG